MAVERVVVPQGLYDRAIAEGAIDPADPGWIRQPDLPIRGQKPNSGANYAKSGRFTRKPSLSRRR